MRRKRLSHLLHPTLGTRYLVLQRFHMVVVRDHSKPTRAPYRPLQIIKPSRQSTIPFTRGTHQHLQVRHSQSTPHSRRFKTLSLPMLSPTTLTNSPSPPSPKRAILRLTSCFQRQILVLDFLYYISSCSFWNEAPDGHCNFTGRYFFPLSNYMHNSHCSHFRKLILNKELLRISQLLVIISVSKLEPRQLNQLRQSIIQSLPTKDLISDPL